VWCPTQKITASVSGGENVEQHWKRKISSSIPTGACAPVRNVPSIRHPSMCDSWVSITSTTMLPNLLVVTSVEKPVLCYTDGLLTRFVKDRYQATFKFFVLLAIKPSNTIEVSVLT